MNKNTDERSYSKKNLANRMVTGDGKATNAPVTNCIGWGLDCHATLAMTRTNTTPPSPCVTDEDFVGVAIREAKKAEKFGDVPVGAIIVRDGEIVARAHNRRERDSDATAHAETLAIRKACKKLGRWNLSDCELFVTLEPCAMCAGAIVNSRIKRVIFGAFDKRFGCGGSLINLLSGSRLNHSAKVTSGVLGDECSKLLSDFFARLRGK